MLSIRASMILTMAPRRVSDSLPLTTKDEWACVLLLSHAWRFTTMRSLAIRELSILTTSAQRIVLGKHYGIHHWLRPAYKDMCEREEGVSDEEGELLGLKDVLKIARARQALRNPPQLIGSSRNSDTVLDDIFGACLAVADGYAVSTKIETIEEPRENPPLSTAAAQIEPLLNAPVSDALCKRLDNILKTIQSTEQEISEFSASLRKAEELHTVAEIQLSQMREQKLFWGTVQQHTACTSAKLDIEKAQRELTRLNTDMDQCYAEMVTAVLPDATTKARLYRPSPDFCKTLRTALSALEAAAQPDPTGADRTLEHVNDMKAHVQFCTRVYACNPNPHTAKAVADARKALKLREDREVKQRLEQQDAQLEVSVAYCRLALVLNELAAAAKLHE
jgi:hypothetical protein